MIFKYCQKYILIFVISIFTLIFSSSNIYAQSIGVNIIYSSQSIFSKQVPIYLQTSSDVDLEGARVQWILPSGINPIKWESLIYSTNISSKNIIYDHIVIDPVYQGVYPITANVSGIYNGNTYNKSSTIYLTFDSNLQLENNSGTHNLKNAVYIFIDIVCLAILIFMAKDVVRYMRNRFRSWLNAEE